MSEPSNIQLSSWQAVSLVAGREINTKLRSDRKSTRLNSSH